MIGHTPVASKRVFSNLHIIPLSNFRLMKKFFVLLSFLVAVSISLKSQPVIDDLPQVTGCIALINAKVTTAPGKQLQTATIILRNGLITDIGPGISIPADAYRIQADSLYAYAGFIDALSYTAIKEPENPQGGGGGNQGKRPPVDEDGNPSLADAGITPFQTVRATMEATSKSIQDWRAQGFTLAHIVPRGKMMPGKGSLILLAGKDNDQLLLNENITMYSQWSGAGGGMYPSTVIAMMAKWRELYTNASQLLAHKQSYETTSLVARPVYNQAHEALLPVVKKEMPVFFRARGVKDISRALELQKDLGMRMVIADAEEAYYLKEHFKNPNVQLVLSLKLPEEKSSQKEVKKDDEAKQDSTAIDKPIDPEKADFEKKRAESLKAHRSQAAEIEKAGIPFAFSTIGIKPGDFRKNLQLILENGLSTDAALASLTTVPAKLLGIDRRCGTLEKGKMANLVVTNKPLFEKETAIRYTIIEGKVYEYEVKEKEKKKKSESSSSSAHALAGKWSYVIETPDQKREGTFTFDVEDNDITGQIFNSDISSGDNDLDDLVFDGKKLSFGYQLDLEGQILDLEFDLTINETTFEGQVSVANFGTFPIHGEKISKPN